MTDPGSFGQTVVCAIAIIVTILFSRNNEMGDLGWRYEVRRFIGVGAIIILFYFMLLSGTRACMLALAIVYSAVLYWLLRVRKRRVQVLGFFCCIASFLILPTIVNNLSDLLLSSHGGEMLSDAARLRIWQGYLSEIVAHPEILIFGIGMDSCNELGQLAGIGNPHNVLIEKTIECGLIGFFLNLGIFYPLIKRKDMRFSNVFTLPFYVFLSTLLVYGSVGAWLPYLLLALINKKKETDYEIKKTFSDG
jgi:O-antigen ligase